MKNMLDILKQSDFHETDVLDLSSNVKNGYVDTLEKSVKFIKTCINLKQMIDFGKHIFEVTVIDEEKMPKYESDLKEWEGKMGVSPQASFGEPHPVVISSYLGRSNANFKRTVNSDNTLADLSDIVDIPSFQPRPEMPVKKVTYQTVVILYFNGLQRIIMDDYEDFKQMYFKYLKLEKMDING